MPITHTQTHQAILGVDLGQSQDPTALALLLHIEQTHSPQSFIDYSHPKTTTWLLAHTETLPLGGTYTQTARHLHRTCQLFHLQYPHTPLLLIADSTGIGAAALELIEQEFAQTRTPTRIATQIEGIIFTSGHNSRTERNRHYVPKLELLHTLATSLESGLLKIPATLPQRAQLTAQFQSLQHTENRIEVQAQRQEHGQENVHHADLIMALSMANWRLRLMHPHSNTTKPTRLPGF